MTHGTPAGEWTVVTAVEQRRLDALATEAGASQDVLVESAGQSAASWILAHAATRFAVVLAGPGGNGADALVVARHLLRAGVDVESFLLASDGAPSPAVQHALALLRDEGGRVTPFDESEEAAEPWVSVERALVRSDLAVDGLYGSGLSRPLGGAAARIVDLVNRTARRVVSLDLPSGVGADGTLFEGPAIRAQVTLAMEFLKPAHLVFPAAELRGEMAVVRVEYPRTVLDEARPWARVVAPRGIADRIPFRMPTGHKGTFGHVLLVAGSSGMVGAAILAGRAALRAGAGLVRIAIPASQAAAVHAALPEALVLPLLEDGGHIVPAALGELRRAFETAHVLAIGPGLSRADETGETVLSALREFSGPVVVDADALFALSRDPGLLDQLAGRAILTPHPGEFSWFCRMTADVVDRDRVIAAPAWAERHGVIVVLKGRPTAIGLPDGRVYLNPTGNTGLATGGSGDVLTGMIAGLVAAGRHAGLPLENAALVAPYIHGRAAEIFSKDRAEGSLLPSDLIELLPVAFREAEPCV